MFLLKIIRQRRKPFVRCRVIRLARQSGVRDDRAERDQQFQFVSATAAKMFFTPEIFGSTVRRNAASSSAPIS